MKLRAYAIRDSAIEAFNAPFFTRAEGEAKRSFIRACTHGELKPFAEYVALYHIGYYDDSSGTLDAVSQPARVMTGLEAVTIDTNNTAQEI